MADSKIIHVKVRNNRQIVFEGEVERISSFNEVGPFDVYPMHANFISILRKGATLYNKKEKIKELTFEQAMMKVKQDKANIFLGLESLMIDEESITAKHEKKDEK